MALITSFIGEKHNRLSGIIFKINWDNISEHNQGAHGFTYIGVTYFNGSRPQTPITLPLHKSLHERMDNYLALKSRMDEDIAKVRQCLQAILKPCYNMQDARDNLPEDLVKVVPGFIGIPRTREPSYAIQGNAIAERMLQKMRDILDFHSIQKLFI